MFSELVTVASLWIGVHNTLTRNIGNGMRHSICCFLVMTPEKTGTSGCRLCCSPTGRCRKRQQAFHLLNCCHLPGIAPREEEVQPSVPRQPPERVARDDTRQRHSTVCLQRSHRWRWGWGRNGRCCWTEIPGKDNPGTPERGTEGAAATDSRQATKSLQDRARKNQLDWTYHPADWPNSHSTTALLSA